MLDNKFFWFLCLLFIIPSSLAQDDNAFSRAQEKIRFAQDEGINGLSFWGMGLTTIPPELGKLTYAVHLDLSNNQLQTLPDVVFTLPNLTKLTLTGNGLLELSPKIAQLTQLQELDVSDNLLTELPPEIGELQSLRILTARNNQLTTLPSEIGNLSALHVLNVGDNQIIQLPSEIGDMASLRGLWVADNQLNALPNEMGAVESLAWINMERNPNQSLPEHVFQTSGTNVNRYDYPNNDVLLAYYQTHWQATQATKSNLFLLFGIVIGCAMLFALVRLVQFQRSNKRKRKRHK